MLYLNVLHDDSMHMPCQKRSLVLNPQCISNLLTQSTAHKVTLWLTLKGSYEFINGPGHPLHGNLPPLLSIACPMWTEGPIISWQCHKVSVWLPFLDLTYSYLKPLTLFTQHMFIPSLPTLLLQTCVTLRIYLHWMQDTIVYFLIHPLTLWLTSDLVISWVPSCMNRRINVITPATRTLVSWGQKHISLSEDTSEYSSLDYLLQLVVIYPLMLITPWLTLLYRHVLLHGTHLSLHQKMVILFHGYI